MKARFGARYRRKKKGSRRHAPRIIIIITITVTVRIRITRERERKVPFQTPADACSKRERKQFRGSWSAQPTLTLNRIPLVFLSTHMRALGSLSPFAKSEASIRATKEEEEEDSEEMPTPTRNSNLYLSVLSLSLSLLLLHESMV